MASTLAINGGKRVINLNRPHYVWPMITAKTKKAVLKQLDESISIYDRSGIVEKLENAFAKCYGKKHALLTNSGTSALHSMFVGANLKKGDEIICPAYSFFATVTPLFFTGAIPILADCESNGNIDPEEIEKRITKRTKGVVITHMWGMPCEMDSIMKIVKNNDLMLFEDASHAYGATYKGRYVGTFGNASAFSLQAQKTLTGGEGGIMITDDSEIFYRALLLGHYNKRCKKEIPKDHPLYEYAVTGMGLKLRIHPIAAAIAYEQMFGLKNILEGRRRIAKRMLEGFNELSGIKVPIVSTDVEPSWYAFVMQYESDELDGLPIKRFYDALLAEGCIELDKPNSTCPLNYHPLFHMPEIFFQDYKGKLHCQKNAFPNAKHFHERSLKLPVWHNEEDAAIIDLYVNAFKKVIERYKDL